MRCGASTPKDQPVPATCSAARAAAAAAVRAKPIEGFLEEGWWERYGGAALEPALRVDKELGDSPVRMVDARYIIELGERGGRLCRRQDLPEEAFVSVEALRRLPKGRGGCLRMMGISHPWQQPDNPDPKGINLRLLARALRSFVEYDGGAPYAVFLDFTSLHQKGPNGEERTAAEAELFKRALSDMMVWYAHPKLLTLKLTQLPAGYPAGFTFPADATPNTAGYFGRGWCFCESSVSNMVKDYDFVLDLGKLGPETKGLDALVKECTAKRDPPLTPADFRRALADKAFTSKKADEETVASLYEATFSKQMGAATRIDCARLQWGDAEVLQLCKVLASGALDDKLEWLGLDGNQIGNEGAKALAAVLDGGSLPKLEDLDLDDNQLSEAGKAAVKAAAEKRSIGCDV